MFLEVAMEVIRRFEGGSKEKLVSDVIKINLSAVFTLFLVVMIVPGLMLCRISEKKRLEVQRLS